MIGEPPSFLRACREAFLWPLSFLSLSGGMWLVVHRAGWIPAQLARLDDLARKSTDSLLALAITVVLIRIGRFVFYERVVLRLAKLKAPKLLDQGIAAVVYFLGAGLTLSYVWGVSISSLVATSGVLGLVLGFALKNVLSDFLSGVALNVETPFALNDFVLVKTRGLPPVVGLVREVSWRSTTLMTPERKLVTLPNTLVAESVVENGSQPSSATEFELEIVLDWSIPAHVLQTHLHAAGLETWIAGWTVEPTRARIRKLIGSGIAYKLTYFVDPLRHSKGKVRDALLGNVHKHLRCAGLRPVHEMAPSPQRAVDYDVASERLPLFEQVELFSALHRTERAALAERVSVRRVAEGAAIVEAGTEGSSMFVVASGLVEVKVAGARVAALAPGDFFGEMSLLTGEPRSATVTALVPCVLYEVAKDAMQTLIETRPALAEAFSELVAARKVRRSGPDAPAATGAAGLSGAIASAIHEFFRA